MVRSLSARDFDAQNGSLTSVNRFGATTYRLKAHGLTIFLDTWLKRPDNLPVHLSLDDVTECDFILISHAHFDHVRVPRSLS